MRETGWLRDTRTLVDGGTFCVSCATYLRLIRWSATCTFCAQRVDREDDAERDGWGYLVDGLGLMQPFCADCLAQLAEVDRGESS